MAKNLKNNVTLITKNQKASLDHKIRVKPITKITTKTKTKIKTKTIKRTLNAKDKQQQKYAQTSLASNAATIKILSENATKQLIKSKLSLNKLKTNSNAKILKVKNDNKTNNSNLTPTVTSSAAAIAATATATRTPVVTSDTTAAIIAATSTVLAAAAVADKNNGPLIERVSSGKLRKKPKVINAFNRKIYKKAAEEARKLLKNRQMHEKVKQIAKEMKQHKLLGLKFNAKTNETVEIKRKPKNLTTVKIKKNDVTMSINNANLFNQNVMIKNVLPLRKPEIENVNAKILYQSIKSNKNNNNNNNNNNEQNLKKPKYIEILEKSKLISNEQKKLINTFVKSMLENKINDNKSNVHNNENKKNTKTNKNRNTLQMIDDKLKGKCITVKRALTYNSILAQLNANNFRIAIDWSDENDKEYDSDSSYESDESDKKFTDEQLEKRREKAKMEEANKRILKEPSYSNGISKLTKKKLKFCIESDQLVLLPIFKELGWIQVNIEDYWNIFWGSLTGAKEIFNYQHRVDDQIVNHFPSYFELTRKDFLVKNIKSYRKNLQKAKHKYAEQILTKTGYLYVYLDIIPSTFVLPTEYNLFLEEYKKTTNSFWIVKPVGRSQGNGIFLVNKLTQLKEFIYKANQLLYGKIGYQSVVIQRYIQNPFLIAGRKFDIRFYVLVTSFCPLKAYFYNDGFCRISSQKYVLNESTMNNLYIHLTNFSVQKRAETIPDYLGTKWSIKNFVTFLTTAKGIDRAKVLFQDIKWLLVQSLLAVAPVMTIDKNSFELYGYDVIIDDELKPWLIEVNACPSIVGTDDEDAKLKEQLIKNALAILLTPNGTVNTRWNHTPTMEDLDKFEVLYDEKLIDDIFAEKELRFKERKENMKLLTRSDIERSKQLLLDIKEKKDPRNLKVEWP